MAACRDSDPGSVYIMQQAYCLAVPYLKSMVSTGLATLASCKYDLKSAILGKKVLNVLCIGHGGGSLPLFLASKIQGANIDIVEIDPLVISASVQAMGFPSFPVMATSDAYDGADIFHHKLWDPHSPFLKALEKHLHPQHGTVVVNLHSDSDVLDLDGSVSSVLHQVLPMGKYVSAVSKAYKDVLVGKGSSGNSKGCGFAYTVSVPWVCNTSLVVCRSSGVSGGTLEKDLVLNALMSEALEIEEFLNLPFSCLEYVKRGFTLVG
ncbi:hypothetical protein NMG60_11031918 [Bertholletia excelsa]